MVINRTILKSIASLLIFAHIIVSCNNDGSQVAAERSMEIPEPDLLLRLRSQKWTTDINRASHIFHIDSITLTSAVDNPADKEGLKIGYQIMKDSLNNIVSIEASPVSRSGDQALTIVHYFDNEGKTFAIEKRTGIINSLCGNGSAYEVKTFFYNSNFRLEHEERLLSNGVNKTPVADSCFREIPYNYLSSPNVTEYLSSSGLMKASR